MDPSDRAVTEPDEERRALAARHEGDLDTGHPAWVRIVTLVVLAVFILATIVAALA